MSDMQKHSEIPSVNKTLYNKEPLRISVSDTTAENILHRSPSPRERRARWIHNMNRMQNQNQRNMNINSKSEKEKKKYADPSHQSNVLPSPSRFNQSFSGKKSKISDSGFNDGNYDPESYLRRGHSDSGAQSSTFDTLESDDSPFENSRKSRRSKKFYDDTWAPTENGSSAASDPQLRLGFQVEQDNVYREGGRHHQSFEIEIEPEHSLSRQNGIRYSLNLRRKLSSPSASISSESEASQEGVGNALNPSSALLIPNGVGISVPGGRKQSVLFSSYDAWNEETIVQSFRDLSPEIGNVLEAAWGGENEKLEELLEDSETQDKLRKSLIRDSEGRTPLLLATACGNAETVQLLLDRGAQINEHDNQKANPIHGAAACGSLPILEILLSHGADVNYGYEDGKTALHWAVQAGSVDCAKKLLEIGALQNSPAIFSETPLHVAATLGDIECLQLLLDYGADSSLCKGPSHSNALHLAAEEGNSQCISILLKSGASPNAKDLRGHTALHIASTCDADSVLALLKGGANPNEKDTNGRTPLHCSVSRGSRAAECVRMLVDKGAEIDAQDNFGFTPLHLSAVNESSQCASILMAKGADVTMKTKAGTTALTLLVRKIPDVMRYLVDRLDSAVTIHDHDPADPDCEVRLDFRGIVPNVDKKQGAYGSTKEQTYYHKPRKETEFLTCILAAGNKKILAHPLSEAFLTLKWQRVRKFFWASLLFQIALVALFTIFVIEVYLIKCPYKRHHFNPNKQEHVTEAANVVNARSFDPNIGNDRPPLSIEIPGVKVNILTVLSNVTGVESEADRMVRRKERIEKRAAAAREFNWFSVTPHSKRKNRTRTNNAPNNGRSIPNENEPTSPTRNLKGKGAMSFGETPTVESPDYDEDGGVKIEEAAKCIIGVHLTFVWGLLIALASLMGIKEIFQLLQSPKSYIMSSENWGQWALIFAVSLTAYISPGYPLSYWQYPAAAVGIFLAWGLMLLQVGRFPMLGLYVQMLGKVAANFGLFISAYFCLLIAFALAFCVLFPEYPPYSSVPLAILKVLTMMVGEVDYEDLFYNEDNANDPVIYPITAHILHGAFVIIVTIVLMNLLVGLAVHDIQGLQKGAKLNRLSRQTALISRLESFIFSKRLQSCLPRSIGSVLLKSALLVPSSYNWSYYFRPNDPRDQRLPKDLKIAALRLAATRHSSKTIKGHPDIRLRQSNNNYANSYGGSAKAKDVQTQVATVRRIEQRLDKLQIQLEMVLKNFNDKFDNLSIFMSQNENNKQSPPE